ncbi:MAG: 4,5-DOPA dioxygenase extradiol [Bacteroidota bacterium]
MRLNELNAMTSSPGSAAPMPVLFVGHGSPMNAIEENEFSEGWKRMAATLPRPAAILCISAHWETRGTFFTAMEQPRTIHDFGGFPKKLFDVQYPAPGDRALAGEAAGLLAPAAAGQDEKWGLDHGCWSVLKRMYPAADIPVVEMSLDYSKPAQYHYDLARHLAPLRKKGVLIIGSGNMVHNLGLVDWSKLDSPGFGYDWALEANGKMKRLIAAHDHAPLIDFKNQGKAFDLAIPSPEHFLPLLYALALREKDEKTEFFNDKAVMGSLTMTSVKIG